MLPTSITLNVGSPAGDVVYDKTGMTPNGGKKYWADSAQGDLEGRPSFEVAHTTTGNGIRRSAILMRRPEFNSTTGTYDGFISTNVTLIRRPGSNIQDILDELEKISELLAVPTVREAMSEQLL